MGTHDDIGPGPLVAGEPVMNVTTGEVRIAIAIDHLRGLVIIDSDIYEAKVWPILQVRRYTADRHPDPKPPVQPSQQALIDAVVSTARDPIAEKAAAKQSPAALAEVQMALLPRCVRCGMLITGPQMATDSEGKPRHKLCCGGG